MPTYEYQCSACGHRFEQFQSMKDKSLRACPKCKKPKLERLIGTGGAIIFKGGGFYQTDYRSDAYTKAAEAEKKSTSESAPTTSPEAKSAAAASPAKTSSEAAGEKPAQAKAPTRPAKRKSK